ncbi:MAG TPA: carboxypeptidase regulatory-like domain-containing protein [Pyrinomonadaceae bacterium]|nr:carboxypeptidase regulatory-like domain-containing protein [Pyrinomonadaceae bacterium]
MRRPRLLISFLWILSCGIAAPIFAQTGGTGALNGTITDSAKATIPDCRITLTNNDSDETRTAITHSDGAYTFPLLPPGSYELRFRAPGFKAVVHPAVVVSVTEITRVDAQLETGELQEEVLVNSQTELVQTESSTLGRVTDGRLITNLPLVSRNYTEIISLSPGISVNVNNASDVGPGNGGLQQGNFRVNGANGGDNNFQLDGIGVNDLQAGRVFSAGIPIPNPDAIKEFKVQTTQYDASYGRNAGANVNVVTKSGTNDFHGSVFEFFRNDKLNANEFFRNATGQPRGVLRQNQFGGTIGGPAVTNKLLFFASYQGTRQLNGVGAGTTSSIFTPPFTDDRSAAALGRMFAGRRGLFQNASGGVGPSIAADGSNISPQALALLNLRFPNGQFVIPNPQTVDPNRAFDLQGFSVFSVPAEYDEDHFLANFDFLHTDRSSFSLRSFFSDGNNESTIPSPFLGIGTSLPGFPVRLKSRFRSVSVSHNYLFGGNVANQISFGYLGTLGRTNQEEAFTFADIGVIAAANENMFPQVSLQGSFSTGGNGQSAEFEQRHFTISDSLVFGRGRHTFRAGGAVVRDHVDLNSASLPGTLIFLSFPDFLLGLPAGPVAAGGNGTTISNVNGTVALPGFLGRKFRVWNANAYVVDDVRVSSSLTLNLGLRYERMGHFADELGRNASFDFDLVNPNPPVSGTLAGYVVANNFPGTVPAGVSQSDNAFAIRGLSQNNFAPRFGFAWRLPQSFVDQAVLRGGYGIYYTRSTGSPFLQQFTAPPFASLTLNFPNTGGAGFDNPFRPAPTFPFFPAYSPTTSIGFQAVAQDYRAPVTQQYSLNTQVAFANDFLLEVGYVGSRGTHQIAPRLPNQALSADESAPIRGQTNNTLANLPLRLPYVGFSPTGLIVIDSRESSWYNSLQVSLLKRFSKGIQFQAAYTLSSALNTNALNTLAAGGGVAATGNQRSKNANYGPSDFNRRHRFVANYVYDLPGMSSRNRLLRGILNRWSTSGVITIQSGLPLTLVGTNTNNAFGITNDHAQLAAGCTSQNLVTSGSIQSKLNNYFNTSCVLRDSAGNPMWQVIGADGRATDFGDSGVGIATGPPQNNFDLALIKRIPLPAFGEATNLEFRAEFFNAFNHPQFSPPNQNVSAATFGVITSTSVNPRIIQFALKANF